MNTTWDPSDIDEQPSRGIFRTASDVVSGLVGRLQFANRSGLSFRGRRNMFHALGYDQVLTPQKYRWRYDRGGIVERLVNAKPIATWRGGGEMVEDEDPDTETPFEKAFNEANRRLKIWKTLEQADILAGIGRYAVVFIGAPGDPATPLEHATIDQVKYLMAYSEKDATITTLQTDTSDERFGLPLVYSLGRMAPNLQTTSASIQKQVHWTRVIHVADGLLDDRVYGRARLEVIWNLLDDLDKVVGGGAEAFWKRADAGLLLDLDPSVGDMSTEDREDMKRQVKDYTHDLERILLTRGVKPTPLTSPVADISGPVKAIVSIISATTGIPQRILLGSERGELASSQDRDEWSERIQDRRASFAGPEAAYPLVDRFISIGAFPKPEKYEARWPTTKMMNDLEKVEMAGKIALMNQAQGEQVVTTNEIRDRYLGLPPIEEVLTPEELAARSQAGTPPPVAERRAAKWAVLTVAEKHSYLARVAAKGREKPWAKLHHAADRFPRPNARIDVERFLEGASRSR